MSNTDNESPNPDQIPALLDQDKDLTVLSDLKKNYTIHERYPAIPQYSILDQSEPYKKNRVTQLQKYFQYRYLHYSTKPFYFSPEDLQLMIEDYFDSLKETIIDIGNKGKQIKFKVYTYEGLIKHCGFVNRNAFNDAEKEPKYSGIIKRAKQTVVEHYETLLQTGMNTGGICFAMKNIANWKDKTEQDINQTIKEIRVNVSSSDIAEEINKL
ncbi:MAG: DNA-packaging protein [Bacteroidales bacterium]|nr:DNA-packaging protein [Bacteroidales bacterium]